MLENDSFKTQSANPGDVLFARSIALFYDDKFVVLLFDVKFILRSFTERDLCCVHN